MMQQKHIDYMKYGICPECGCHPCGTNLDLCALCRAMAEYDAQIKPPVVDPPVPPQLFPLK